MVTSTVRLIFVLLIISSCSRWVIAVHHLIDYVETRNVTVSNNNYGMRNLAACNSTHIYSVQRAVGDQNPYPGDILDLRTDPPTVVPGYIDWHGMATKLCGPPYRAQYFLVSLLSDYRGGAVFVFGYDAEDPARNISFIRRSVLGEWSSCIRHDSTNDPSGSQTFRAAASRVSDRVAIVIENTRNPPYGGTVKMYGKGKLIQATTFDGYAISYPGFDWDDNLGLPLSAYQYPSYPIMHWWTSDLTTMQTIGTSPNFIYRIVSGASEDLLFQTTNTLTPALCITNSKNLSFVECENTSSSSILLSDSRNGFTIQDWTSKRGTCIITRTVQSKAKMRKY